MQSYYFYGFDLSGRLTLSKIEELARVEEARRRADDLLSTYRRVEVWQGPVCVFRSDPHRSYGPAPD
jgi:hypothetical protein